MTKESKPIIQATLGDLKEMIEDMFATPTDQRLKDIWFMDWQDWQNCLEFVSQPLLKLKVAAS